MITTREEKKAEAVERMQLFGVYPQTIRDFEESDLVSFTAGTLGACYWLEEDQKQRVRDFEEKYNAVVFHVLPVTYREIGKTEAYLYICDDPSEWDADREDMRAGQVFCYVSNLSHPDMSEFGVIGIELSPGAGIRRTY